MKDAYIKQRHPTNVLGLFHKHKTRRLEFAKEHVNWILVQWKNALFTNETRIQLWKPDGQNHVYRRVLLSVSSGGITLGGSVR